MSLLDTAQVSGPTEIVRKASRLKRTPAVQFEQLLQSWKEGINLLWSNEDLTAGILAELGTDAAELFALSSATITFLESLKAGSTTSTLALVRPFTVHQDGTVTVD